MKDYYPRIADDLLAFRLRSKGAVLVEGPKWCGKTTTCAQQAKSALYLQDPSTRAQNMRMAELGPQLLLEGEAPRLIDEWQDAPALWDAVRFEVDQGRMGAPAFLMVLTGLGDFSYRREDGVMVVPVRALGA